jgi:hypothetical protein
MENPQKPPIVFLFEAYEEKLSRVRGNQAQIKNLKIENQNHRDDMHLAKQNMAELFKILIKEEGSLYKVFQKYFGDIDKRYYRICSLLSDLL